MGGRGQRLRRNAKPSYKFCMCAGRDADSRRPGARLERTRKAGLGLRIEKEEAHESSFMNPILASK
jgi:hypothetical protein